jgi:uncharacterized protein (TIGR02757 family)
VDLFSVFEAAYRTHHSLQSRARDPIHLVHGFEAPRDQEVAGLLCALVAYGNVTTILKSAATILAPLGNSPAESLVAHQGRFSLPLFRHRFTTGEDIEILYFWIYSALSTHGSLERFFIGNNTPEQPIKILLSDFIHRFTEQPLPSDLATKRRSRERQLKYLLSSPERGSACKRLNMFLRWMVRPKDGIDLGLWKSIDPSALILPLDTHLLQTLRALKWTKSEQASWKTAEQATQRLKKLCPHDPIRYDFALCHLSMEGGKILHYKSRHA